MKTGEILSRGALTFAFGILERVAWGLVGRPDCFGYLSGPWCGALLRLCFAVFLSWYIWVSTCLGSR